MGWDSVKKQHVFIDLGNLHVMNLSLTCMFKRQFRKKSKICHPLLTKILFLSQGMKIDLIN